ncbi:MAG TPA: pantoate--beta-alanine ligase [Baekduia sp.]|nr:pantoate--beta-alanine ligase [Baekduia sp.]
MKTITTIAALRTELAQGPRPIGLVPTMGALHTGHLSLVARAASKCPQVVVSVFVNPTQFDDPADLRAYQRDLDSDAALAEDAGATILFAPDAGEMYPEGFATSVTVTGPLTETLEGAQRGAQHFHGVTTVVTKLLNIVAPDVAYFGQKDAQQALVIRRLVTDLNLDVKIEVLPTVRDEDGLALSSRNARLSAADRDKAIMLHAALQAARQAARSSDDPMQLRTAALDTLARAEVEPEYVAIVDPQNLSPVSHVNGAGALVAIAARIGGVRLIDNLVIEPSKET